MFLKKKVLKLWKCGPVVSRRSWGIIFIIVVIKMGSGVLGGFDWHLVSRTQSPVSSSPDIWLCPTSPPPNSTPLLTQRLLNVCQKLMKSREGVSVVKSSWVVDKHSVYRDRVKMASWGLMLRLKASSLKCSAEREAILYLPVYLYLSVAPKPLTFG